MSNSISPGRRLRDAWKAGIVQIPGVYNPLVARLAEEAGFQAIYLSGAALSASMGMPDVGLVTLSEFVDFARNITSACKLPLISDADTGFGEALNVERTVQQFEAAGVAGIHLEDQVMPKRCGHLSGKKLVSKHEMDAKVRAAVGGRTDPDFVIIARTDARGVTNFDDAVSRAKLYLEAGADAIFPEAMQGEDEFARFAKAVPCPLLANMTEFGKSPLIDVENLGRMGYRMILFPLTAFRAAMKAAEATLLDLFRNGTQKNSVPAMQTRAELYDVLGYQGYEERDRNYFG